MHWTKIIKAFSLITLGAALILISVDFIINSRRDPKLPTVSVKIDDQKIDSKEKIEHYEAEGEKGNLQIRAERNYMGENDLYHLEGNVEVVFYRRGQGEDVYLYGDEILYDKEWSHFSLKGEARIQIKDMTIQAASLDYDAGRQFFRSREKVDFTSDQIEGSALGITYLLPEKKIILLHNVRVALKTVFGSSVPLWVDSNRFEYTRRGRKGLFQGAVMLRQGESLASCEALRFDLVASGDHIRSLRLVGGVEAVLLAEKPDDSAEEKDSAFVLYSARREVNAEEISILSFKDLALVRLIKASGDCRFRFVDSDGAFTLIEAESVDFTLDKQGQLVEFAAEQRAGIMKQSVDEDFSRIEGETLVIGGNRKIMKVKGGKERKAHIRTPESEISAPELTVHLESNNLEGTGGIDVILEAGDKEGTSLGLFSADSPVLIHSQEMRYIEERRRFIFKEEVKAWQGMKMLWAQELSLFRDSGRITGSEKIRTAWPYHSERGEKDTNLEINADEMRFDPEKNQLDYEGNCQLKMQDVALRSASLQVSLDVDQGELLRIIGRERVVVTQGSHEGRGETADYDLQAEEISLTGNPVLLDKTRGRTEGDKLTFHIPDGKIIVENKDRKRSTTLIKS